MPASRAESRVLTLTLDSLRAALPTVHTLKLPSEFNEKCVTNCSFLNCWDGAVYTHDVLFHAWLMHNYSRTVESAGVADLVYIPAYPSVCTAHQRRSHCTGSQCNPNWWKRLNAMVRQAQDGKGVRSEALFGAATYPLTAPRRDACMDYPHERSGVIDRCARVGGEPRRPPPIFQHFLHLPHQPIQRLRFSARIQCPHTARHAVAPT